MQRIAKDQSVATKFLLNVFVMLQNGDILANFRIIIAILNNQKK